MFDVLRDFDCLPLVAEARQNLDKAPQECVARKQQEEKYENRLQAAKARVLENRVSKRPAPMAVDWDAPVVDCESPLT
jgi:hypothetical protein